MTPSALAETLQNMGYRAVPHELTVESATNGLTFTVYVQEDGWLQFALAVVNGFDYSLSEVNDFNCKFRFGKVFLDKQNDIMLTFDLSAKYDPKASLSEGVSLWSEIVGLFLGELSKRDALARYRATSIERDVADPAAVRRAGHNQPA
jgi:Putative bacterial sensory transduction regulator